MSSARYLKVVSKFEFAALALAIFASAGNAQNAYEGKFKLPFEVYWGGATLPAGSYTFVMGTHTFPYTLYIRSEKTNVIVEALASDTGVRSNHAQLDLVDVADGCAIRSFEAPELGVTFTYFTPKDKHAAPKEVRDKGVSRAEPASQVGENEMPIAVQTSGR